ncbi:unnamed protein product, partial [Phaeothamnion confervicola]
MGQRGKRELELLGLDARDAEKETPEDELDARFDLYEEDGNDKLRVLDSFVIYDESGRMVPPAELDDRRGGGRFVAFGMVLPNLEHSVRNKLIQIDNRTHGQPGLCLPKPGTSTEEAYAARAAGALEDGDDSGGGGGDEAAAGDAMSDDGESGLATPRAAARGASSESASGAGSRGGRGRGG